MYEIQSMDIIDRSRIDYHFFAEEKSDGTYFFKNNYTEIPNVFQLHRKDLAEYAFNTAIGAYMSLLTAGAEDTKPPFKGKLLFSIRYKDGSIEWHSFCDESSIDKGDLYRLMKYNDLISRSMTPWNPVAQRWLPTTYYDVFANYADAKLTLGDLNKTLKDGFVPLQILYDDLIFYAFDDCDSSYSNFMKIESDYSLRLIYFNRWNSRIQNEITIDNKGFIQNTGNIPLLNRLKEMGIRITHSYSPGLFEIGLEGTCRTIENEYTAKKLKEIL